MDNKLNHTLRGQTVVSAASVFIHELIEEQARKNPDSIALISDHERITYADLDMSANRICRLIQESASGEKAFVGVAMRRSPLLIQTLLGILKAGFAYIPLDPAYPEERLLDIITDTGAPIVCADSDLSGLFAASSAKVICMDDQDGLANFTHTSPLARTKNSIAYVIYTSGSTGKPKGVVCRHEGVTNLLSDFQNRQPLGPGDICSWWTSLNFDVSVYEIFSALVEGAALIVVPDSVRSSGPDLMKWFCDHQVTSAYIPPFMVADLDAWVRKNPGQSELRRLLVGVEPIPEKTLLSIHDMVPGLRVINGYGPTETTICATLYTISPDNDVHDNAPIGRPVQNTFLRVLDEKGHMVGAGDSGELFIGGRGLADGYLNRPELTADRFVKDPFSEAPEARLYKTGDQVLILDDGNLEFLGRIDEQVKLRGYRIELGEIETQLRKIRGIREAVVVVQEEGQGNSLLVAYLVAHEGYSLSLELIMEHLKKYLPDYMIPSAFIKIDRVPSTTNGKTDRKSLPKPCAENLIRAEKATFSGSLTPVESKLIDLFQEVLKITSVGVGDNFFALGGHSLLAVQLVSRIRDLFGVQIDLTDIFQAPRIQDLSKLIQTAAPEEPLTGFNDVENGFESQESGLSFSQMRVWYLDQLEPGTPAYNICLAYDLEGPLDVNCLDKSLAEIVDRHSSLRTVFEKRGSEPFRVVSEGGSFSLAFEDLTHIPSAGRRAEARMLCVQESQRGFDLTRGPLFRCLLLRIDHQSHILLFTMSHIISDGWSVGIIVRELMTLYSGFVAGSAPTLTPLTIDYGDYVRFQRRWMTSNGIKSQLKYWEQRFLTIPEPLNLQTDKPRPPIQSYRGSCETLTMEESLCQTIRDCAAKNGATLFMVLLAGLKALLCRYTEQNDICVGTFVANRSRRELENLVGFFINTLAIRSRIEDNSSFRNLLTKVRQNTLGAYTNQDVPFEKVLEAVNPERSLARTPLFQVMMVLQNMPLPPLELHGIKCHPIEMETFRSNFDMTFWVYEESKRIKINLEYSSDIFAPPTIKAMLEHFRNLLYEACAHPETKISELEFLGKEETSLILNDFSGKNRRFSPPGQTVTSMFENEALANPTRTALIDWVGDTGQTREMTYFELNSGANNVARLIRDRGPAIETNVAIIINRTRFMIMGMIGIMKAGAYYLPIDPGQPLNRMSFMLNDASSRLALTDSENLPKLKELNDSKSLSKPLELICLDTCIQEIEVNDNVNPPSPALNQAAYAIYTSGSSGQPKGVLVEHGALASFTQSALDLYGLRSDDRILQFASPSFDASVEEIFPCFASGATLVLRSDSMIRSAPHFLAVCEDLGITALDLPTAFWSQLVASLESGSSVLPKSLRLVIIGGEQAPYESVMTWMKIVGASVRLFNTYGPSEATVVATAIELTGKSSMLSVRKSVPIGIPLPNVRTYVLDRNLKPTPIGTPGELFIGGESLARGYINLPEKTNECFIPDPFEDGAGRRMYKTGDRVRYVEDGSLEFLGRVDRQIKIRGFRVELEEIEAALGCFEEIQQSIVVPWQNASHSWTLTAFLIPSPLSKVDSEELRGRLTSRLPDFMVPSSFVMLEKMPMTPAGKIDFQALVKVASSFHPASDSKVPPRNPVEKALTEIWSEVFGRETVGVRDNFFDLGGHSLLSLQIIDRVNKAGLYLTPAQFMQNPTIEKQAQVISTARPSSTGAEWGSLVELQPYGSRPRLYFVHSTPGDVLGYSNVINKLGADQPCFGFQSLGLRDPDQAHKTVEQMASFYVDEMLAFQKDPPYCLVGWCYGGIVAAEMATQMEARKINPALLVLIETPFPRMKTGQATYYLSRVINLLRMGPKGWTLYIKNKIEYRKRIKSGAMEEIFSLKLDHGPLANRSNVYRTNMAAISEYHMKQVPSCPVKLIQGEELEEGYIPDVEELWLKKCRNVKLYAAPGNHLTILKEPGATVVVAQLKEFIRDI